MFGNPLLENGKVNFPGPVGPKRRRMRSGGNVSTITNNSLTPSMNKSEENISEEKTTQTSKCKGATTIPIFLKKTYKMVDTCDPSIASWTEEGDMFVVKDPDLFASQVIPQYFDHNKFSSFARQLNFYGFRKMQSKPIRNSDFDAETAKHVTFFNENFKRGRCDLLKKIQRSTRGGGSTNPQDQSRELQTLRDLVTSLEMKMIEMEAFNEERVRRLELDMLARMEQMMVALQQQQQQVQNRLEKVSSIGTSNSGANTSQTVPSVSSNQQPILASQSQMQTEQQLGQQQQQQQQMNLTHQNVLNSMSQANNWVEPGGFAFSRNSSVNSGATSVANNSYQFQTQQAMSHMEQQSSHVDSIQQNSAPTLPPHPKQKMLPLGSMPGMMGAPPSRFNSLRGISTLSRGFSGLSRGASTESTGIFDENMFNLLMMEINEHGGANNASQTQMIDPGGLNMLTEATGSMRVSNNPAVVSNQSHDSKRMNRSKNGSIVDRDELSDVSVDI